jgi:AcrR family transcriptional regulator
MRDDKRDRILAAATAVFAERDFHQVSVSEVAERAGVGKGTLYLYFPTKDALQTESLRASLTGIGEQVEELAARDASLEDTLRGIVLSILRFFWRRPHLLTVVQRFEQRGGKRARERRRRVMETIDAVLARHHVGNGGPGKSLRSAFLLGMARAAILEHAAAERPETHARAIVDIFLHGVAGRSGARRRKRAAA